MFNDIDEYNIVRYKNPCEFYSVSPLPLPRLQILILLHRHEELPHICKECKVSYTPKFKSVVKTMPSQFRIQLEMAGTQCLLLTYPGFSSNQVSSWLVNGASSPESTLPVDVSITDTLISLMLESPSCKNIMLNFTYMHM